LDSCDLCTFASLRCSFHLLKADRERQIMGEQYGIRTIIYEVAEGVATILLTDPTINAFTQAVIELLDVQKRSAATPPRGH
jgi:hypothetical protein